jgi:hypothetical protein
MGLEWPEIGPPSTRARGAPETAALGRSPRSAVVAPGRLGTSWAIRRRVRPRRRARLHRRRAGILDPSLTSQSREMGKVEAPQQGRIAMLPFPSGQRCSALAVAVLLALAAATVASAQPPRAEPTRGGAMPSAARVTTGTEAVGSMAPMQYAVFFCRVSGPGQAKVPCGCGDGGGVAHSGHSAEHRTDNAKLEHPAAAGHRETPMVMQAGRCLVARPPWQRQR